MKRFLVVAFCSLSLSFAQDAPEAKMISLEELREGLGSDHFKDRQEATKGIWEMGEASLSLLAELEESGHAPVSESDSPDEQAEAVETREWLASEITELPERE